MKKDTLFLYVLFVLVNACKSQDKTDDHLGSSEMSIAFEEKQKRDKLNVVELKSGEQAVQLNFRMAAKKATRGVVHIISTYTYTRDDFSGPNSEFWFRFFSEENAQKEQAKGSGVIVSSDGYIITNSHIVEGAENIEVVLENQRAYKAKIIGLDSRTDLSLIKIEANNLPFIEFGNSDEVEVGDWVLAVGNPFNLTSTVTAGIVSAKARNIDMLKNEATMESYIQTDAAINPGNSGGALVDMNGKLVGINSIIASPTGAYAGYSFATPVNIVKKVSNDLLRGGKVNRGYLGVTLKNLTEETAKKFNTEIIFGVYIDSIIEGGSAMEADLKARDIILSIDEHKILTPSQIWEIMEQHSPGEILALKILRNGTEKNVAVTLKALDEKKSEPAISKKAILKKLGITLEVISEKEKKKRKIKSGLKVVGITDGKIYQHTNINKGFIITAVNNIPVNTIEEFENAFLRDKENVLLEGVYPGFPGVFYYYFKME